MEFFEARGVAQHNARQRQCEQAGHTSAVTLHAAPVTGASSHVSPFFRLVREAKPNPFVCPSVSTPIPPLLTALIRALQRRIRCCALHLHCTCQDVTGHCRTAHRIHLQSACTVLRCGSSSATLPFLRCSLSRAPSTGLPPFADCVLPTVAQGLLNKTNLRLDLIDDDSDGREPMEVWSFDPSIPML